MKTNDSSDGNSFGALDVQAPERLGSRYILAACLAEPALEANNAMGERFDPPWPEVAVLATGEIIVSQSRRTPDILLRIDAFAIDSSKNKGA